MVILVLVALFSSYKQAQHSPLTLMRWFKGEREQRLRYVEFALLTQHPSEPLFEGTIFVNLEDSELTAGSVVARIGKTKFYAGQKLKLNLVRDGEIIRTSDFTRVSLSTTDGGHGRFPFDTSRMEFELSFDPPLPIEVVRLVNRVPGFVLDDSSFVSHRDGSGTIKISFVLHRNLFTQVLSVLLFVSSLLFAVLILQLNDKGSLASAVAAFFFSIWSLRGILGEQIRTFPTVFDYAVFLLCSFMLVGLLWRLITLGRDRGDSKT